VRIRHYFEASDGTYGYRRIHADLVDESRECSPELVRHILAWQSTNLNTRAVLSEAPRMYTLSELTNPNCPHCLTRCYFSRALFYSEDCGAQVGDKWTCL
jgi:hypothetical protein